MFPESVPVGSRFPLPKAIAVVVGTCGASRLCFFVLWFFFLKLVHLFLKASVKKSLTCQRNEVKLAENLISFVSYSVFSRFFGHVISSPCNSCRLCQEIELID
jgi:hypothetical protein